VPMQPPTDTPRDNLTAAQVVALLQAAEARNATAGLELVDLDLNVLEDISDDLAGGRIDRNSYAELHATASLQITRSLDWGNDLVRPYLTLSAGSVSARFYLGVYQVSTPAWDLEESPPTFDVDGYDVLLRLDDSVGDAYSIAAGDAYLTRVADILTDRGYTQVIIDQTAAATVAPASRTWAFADETTWLSIVNDLLASVGYAGIWSDWNGRLRCEPYVLPVQRSVEWTYTDDVATTMLGTKRTVQRDYFNAWNRWVFYQQNQVDGATPVEGAGRVTIVNQSVGDTSVDARRGLVRSRPAVGLDAANQAALVVQALAIVSADMDIPTVMESPVALNPLHWHFDRLLVLTDDPIVADVMCTTWSIELPPSTELMRQSWRTVSQ
jgi:hypothetical protein